MSINSYEELVTHVGHNVIVVGYGRKAVERDAEEGQYVGVAIECETCDCVLFDWDGPIESTQNELKPEQR